MGRPPCSTCTGRSLTLGVLAWAARHMQVNELQSELFVAQDELSRLARVAEVRSLSACVAAGLHGARPVLVWSQGLLGRAGWVSDVCLTITAFVALSSLSGHGPAP